MWRRKGRKRKRRRRRGLRNAMRVRTIHFRRRHLRHR
jgi:hypothetical protein